MNVTSGSVRYRIDVEKAGVWRDGQVLFDIRTPLPALYTVAQEFQAADPEHNPVRVVVVHVFKVEQIEIVRVFGDVAEPVAGS